MKKATVAVLFGGYSTEYEVSLQSAYSVIGSLDSEKYHIIMLGITRQGQWLRYCGDINHIKNDTWHKHPSCVNAVISPDRNTHGVIAMVGEKATTIPIDVAFPILHGKNGEDGTIQGLLELAGIPCVGCGTLSSALCMDKDIAHRLVKLAGIKTPNSVVVDSQKNIGDIFKRTAHLHYPLFVKPVNSGSSFGISRITSQSELKNAIHLAFRHDGKVIVEEAVNGFEAGCAILGNEILIIGEIDEIELSKGFFDFSEKYTLKTSSIHMPARIDSNTANRIKQIASKVYRVLCCTGYARVDFFITPENEVVFNEVNTIPGFTAQSRYPNMMKGIGMSFAQILDELIRLAMQQ